MFRRLAFTLAEVLIVLGIIGIIADMTIPTLKRDIDKIVYVTQLKKAYSSISQGIQMMQVNDGVFNVVDSSVYCNENDCFNASGNWAKKTFNVVGDYGNKTPSCFATAYKSIDKGIAENPGDNHRYVIGLADGSCMSIRQTGFIGTATELAIDINGAKKPNIAGRDLFWLNIYQDGSVNESSGGADPDDCGDNTPSYGKGCFTKIIQDGWKMDY